MARPTGKAVDYRSAVKDLNKAVEFPNLLTSDDGRVFDVIEWEVHVAKDTLVTVTIKATVHLPEEDEQ